LPIAVITLWPLMSTGRARATLTLSTFMWLPPVIGPLALP
jgi:hypothetical protein